MNVVYITFFIATFGVLAVGVINTKKLDPSYLVSLRGANLDANISYYLGITYVVILSIFITLQTYFFCLMSSVLDKCTQAELLPQKKKIQKHYGFLIFMVCLRLPIPICNVARINVFGCSIIWQAILPTSFYLLWEVLFLTPMML